MTAALALLAIALCNVNQPLAAAVALVVALVREFARRH